MLNARRTALAVASITSATLAGCDRSDLDARICAGHTGRTAEVKFNHAIAYGAVGEGRLIACCLPAEDNEQAAAMAIAWAEQLGWTERRRGPVDTIRWTDIKTPHSGPAATPRP